MTHPGKYRLAAVSRVLPLIGALAFGTASSGAQEGQAAGNAAPIVPGYERLRDSDVVDDRARGEVLLGELNCMSCHAVSDPARNAIAQRINTKPAPDLSDIGQRVTPEWLASYLANVHEQKPGSTMPDLFHSFAPRERDEIVEELTHFLLGQGGRMESAEYLPFRFRATVESGRLAFHSLGCAACHEADLPGVASTGPTAPATPSVPLPDLAAKTSVGALTRFLMQPDRVRHGGRMPSLHLTEEEATNIAVYLLREQEPDVVEKIAGLEFEYFRDPMPDEDAEGFFSRPPPVYDELTPEGVGQIQALSLDLPIPTRRGNHMYRFGGVIDIEEPGSYTFVLTSDRRSGSELLIDGEPVATKSRDSGREIPVEVELAAGDHAITVTYYIRGDTRQPFVAVTVEGGSIGEPTPIERLVAYENVVLAPRSSGPLATDPDRARRGGVRFAEIGCASCHALESVPAGVAPLYPAPPIDALSVEALRNDTPVHQGAGTPRYNLAGDQKRALAAALSNLDELAGPRDARQQVLHTLATYNCYACHTRIDANGEIGGPDATRRGHFKVLGGQDLGDEGRIPPTLTGIGGKLKPAALAAILNDEQMQVRRNYMETRMPRFGGALIGQLAAALDEVDAIPGDLTEPTFSRRAVEDGLELVGSEGLRCITCHDIGANTAAGISTINLSTTYDRLRPGWVRRLLEDPHSINNETRMPAFWTEGTVIHPDIAGGTVGGQIDAIWSYLSLGSSMPIPKGMNLGESMVLRPTDEPILFRTFMADASPRAIVVGYPESVHVAFDANVMRLVKVWRGGFFDAQGTWSGRAGRFLDPYGDEVIIMPPGPALAFLDSIDSLWPPVKMTDRNVGGEFLGYRLDDQRRPIFRYRLGNVDIEENFVPVVSPGGTNLVRRFALEAGAVSGDMYLLVAEGDEITRNQDGSWVIDGSVTVVVRAPDNVQPIVRTSQGVRQLLLPVGIATNQAVLIEVEISW